MNIYSIDRRSFLRGSAALGAAMVITNRTAQAETKVMRAQSNFQIEVLDPAHKKTEAEDAIMMAILPRLITYRADNFDWELQDAESIEQVDPTHVRFTLRPGLQWTNGFGEVSAEDVKFSYERVANPDTGSAYQSDWANLDHVEVTDKLSGVIVLKAPMAALFSATLPKATGAIVCKAAVEKLPEKRYVMDIPASCGPYAVKEWIPNQRTVLARNDSWGGAPAAYDEVIVLPIIDPQTAETAFDAGELDATQVSMSSIPRLKANPRANSKFVSRPALAYYWLGMQVEHPLYQDIRVRQAVQNAVDINQILEGAFFGAAGPATGILSPGIIGYREQSLLPQKPDLDKARQLLAEAGRADGFKTRLTTKSTTEFVAAAEIIQSQLAPIGIEVEISAEDSGAIWDRAQSKDGWKDDQMLLWRYSVAPDPSWFTAWFTPDQVGQWNWERWSSAEFGDLHVKALTETDPEKRATMYRRMQDLMDESAAYRFITHGVNSWTYDDALNLQLWPDAYQPSFRHCQPA